MSIYLIPIRTAILVFPLLALLITLPYILIQYNKYGSILVTRVTIVYSFIFYLLCAYFFTMLPLPSRTEVAKLTTPYVSLELFSSVKLLLSTTVFNIHDMSTWLPALLQPNCFTIYFNILMVIPLGIYLRYYFKKGWLSTTIICFLVSLSFELIQLSGLFGIYSRPYRLFELDDLFFNTLGGIIGYIITPILVRYLPTKDELEETSYLRGHKVSGLRRISAMGIDLIIILLMNVSLIFMLKGRVELSNIKLAYSTYVATIFIYFILFNFMFRGQTLGKMIVKIKLVNSDGGSGKLYNYIIRYIYLFIVVLPSPLYLLYLVNIIKGVDNINLQYFILGIIFIISFVFIASALQLFVAILSHRYRAIHSRLSNLHNISIINYKE